MEHWTIQKVKDELPKIVVIYNDEKFLCQVSGRKLHFAHVHSLESGHIWEYSWETIARSLNSNMPLIA